MKNILYLLVLTFFLGSTVLAENSTHAFVPEKGWVPNEQTAIRIAEAVWLPIYGDYIYKKKPFVAKLYGDVWIVQGSLSPQMLGGVPIAEISKKTGEILRISHSK